MTPNTREISSIEASHFFDFHAFRKSHDGGLKEESFIYQFSQTAMFSNFIENWSFNKTEFDEEIMFFDNSLKEMWKKKKNILSHPEYPWIVKALTP